MTAPDPPPATRATLEELEWRRQRAVLHGAWDEAAHYATLLRAQAPTAPDRVAPVGRACPAGYPIKAKRGKKRYYLPGARWSMRVTPDLCFATEAAAQVAGYRPARR